jgi:hypothetical protein
MAGGAVLSTVAIGFAIYGAAAGVGSVKLFAFFFFHLFFPVRTAKQLDTPQECRRAAPDGSAALNFQPGRLWQG